MKSTPRLPILLLSLLSTGGVSGTLPDRPLAPFQEELLDIAFAAASSLPLNPHIKNRSRFQENVVTACIELGQLQRAFSYIEKIENWRQGAAYADLAFHCAEQGHREEALRLLDLAHKVAEKPFPKDDDEPEASALNWERDRIRVKIARTHAFLGKTELAAEFEKGATESETGKVDAVRAMRSNPEDFEKQLQSIDKLVATGNFDMTKNALDACAQLFGRFYEDREKRDRAEKKIKSSWSKLPLQVRIELMMQLVEFALGRKDGEKALALVDETKGILESATWTAEHRIPLLAKIARLRAQAGDREKARQETDAAYILFGESREQIVNIYRARALRPVAEAYHVLGDKEVALATYMHTVAEGMENPNSRPRAEDLLATCCSLARYGVEPDEDLWTRLRQTQRELREPW